MGIDQYLIRRRPAVESPTLRDLLDDPATQLLMQRDGVRKTHLVNLLAAARHRLTAARSLDRRPGRIGHISRVPGGAD